MRSTSSGRVRAAVAAITIGAVAVLVGPALTAAAATSSTTIRGEVRLGSTALAGYRVGFFDPADASVITGRTAADGTFSLQVPSDVQGFAFAGSDPAARNAVSAYRGRNFVRGVIGLHQPRHIAGVIYQSLSSALPAALADGGTIRFRVQHAGRVTGTGNLPKGSEVTIERLNGARVAAAIADAHGTFRTKALVPGRYRLVFRGGSSLLAKSKVVTVVADRTVRIAVPHLVKGGVLQGTVKSGGEVVRHPVTVLVSSGGTIVRQQTTTAKGGYRFVRLAAGRYTVTFADNPPAFTDDGQPANQPSSDDYLHSVRHATVPKRLGTVTLNAVVAPAGRISGTAPTTSSSVVVERQDGTVVRAAQLTKAAFTVGGLPSGSYTLLLMTKQGELARRTAVVHAGSTTKLGRLVTTSSAPSVSGSISGPATSGSITFSPQRDGYVGPRLYGTIAKDGTWSAPHVFPGTYSATVFVDTESSRTQTVTVTGSTTDLDLLRAAPSGTLSTVFTSHGHQLQDVSGSATDTAGHLVGFNSRFSTEFTTEAASGTYAFRNPNPGFDLERVSAPAADGPWWYDTPDGGFTVSPGATTHVVRELTIGH